MATVVNEIVYHIDGKKLGVDVRTLQCGDLFRALDLQRVNCGKAWL